MKIKLLFPVLIMSIIIFSSCNQQQAEKETPPVEEIGDKTYVGVKIDEDGAMDIGKLTSDMAGKDEMKAKVKGKVEKVCQKKGCWMTLVRPEGDPMRVTFKDYGFFVPKDISGKEVVIEGIAMLDTTSVDMLRHYAEDEGASKEEIEKITEAEIEVVFEAEGVIIL
ncbi:MAG: DUF4920 domain-containing protein [Chitinophagales bacterium]|nr:DUF4920 domain-containing protein [Chitinophagales bacterium]